LASGFGAKPRAIATMLILLGLSMVLFAIAIWRSLAPLRVLSAATEGVANGNLDLVDSPNRLDEVGKIQQSLRSIVDRTRMLLAGEAQNSRIVEEVNIAAEIQTKLLPPAEVKTTRFEIQSHYQSATETGGDYWGYIESFNHVILYVGDVTGHGIPSALVTAGVRGCFSALAHRYQMNPTLIPNTPEILALADQAVKDTGRGELHMTLFVLIINLENGQVEFTSAGHPPALLFRNQDGKVSAETLHNRGPRLGESGVFTPGEPSQTSLKKGDTLFLYTDGLFEDGDTNGRSIDKAILKEKISNGLETGKTLDEVKTALEFDLFEIHRGNPTRDDITFCLMRLT
jgi:sigma-B regulation protein RsbU (phosphoserine phosphatase)